MRILAAVLLIGLGSAASATKQLVCLHQCGPLENKEICNTTIFEHKDNYFTEVLDPLAASGMTEDGRMVSNMWSVAGNDEDRLFLVEIIGVAFNKDMPGVHSATFARKSKQFVLGFQGVQNVQSLNPKPISYQLIGTCVEVDQ